MKSHVLINFFFYLFESNREMLEKVLLQKCQKSVFTVRSILYGHAFKYKKDVLSTASVT